MAFAHEQIPLNADLAAYSEVLHALWQKSLSALQSLQTPLGIMASGREDQFHAIFGRDSLWTVLLALEAARTLQARKAEEHAASIDWLEKQDYMRWLHALATTVLRGLSKLQGTVVNDVNEEQPGRIVHEYWNPIPERMIKARWPVIDGRYYGAFDATFLYLITAAQVINFFDDDALLAELWPHIAAALDWMARWSDLDGDGLVEYRRRNPEGIGLANQVWKDSAEAIRGDHQPILHPLAWVEVQGYAWAAYAAVLDLAARAHRPLSPGAQEIRQRMAKLQQGLSPFWLADEQYPAIALDGQKRPVAVVSSNPGHLLWSGCVEQAQAGQICQRLMQSDILTPWGIRTLSERAYYYNPLMYHCGAIWPFDNAIIAAGMRRYGYEAQARLLALHVLHAIHSFDAPVEVYTVQPSRWIRFPRVEQEWFLADYFYACNVQAWTAAAVLSFVSMLL